ncbi:MAG: amidohydrolase family protein [Paracoccaceae bacterium]|nr:amidohydrolase family protein [Paracoccaceae bacterium]
MIDIHTHMLRPTDWGDEYKNNWNRGYGSDWPEPKPEIFDAAMKEANIKSAVVFGIRATHAGVFTPTKSVVDFCKLLETPTTVFMALDLNDADLMDQLEEGIELGAKGIKLYPVMAAFDPADEKFNPLYEVAETKKLPILWHMGATLSTPGDLAFTNPLILDKVARRFPSLIQIIAHMGHPWQRDAVQVVRKNRNVFCDISGFWTRPMDGYLALLNAQEWGVIDKLLFGSDFPLWTPKETIKGLYKLTEIGSKGFPRVEKATIEQILKNDSGHLLGL